MSIYRFVEITPDADVLVEDRCYSAVVDVNEQTKISTSGAPKNDNQCSQGRLVGDRLYVS